MLITDFGSLKLDSDPDQERVINIKVNFAFFHSVSLKYIALSVEINVLC